MDPVGKAVIYVTSARGLLLHHEPDFPDVPWQIPGGTIEPGEEPLEAAKRELFEETGLRGAAFTFLGDVVFKPDFECPHDTLHRHFYHTHFSNELPMTWDHVEEHSSEDEGPLLFRFRWFTLKEADRKLGLRLNSHLHLVPALDL